MAEKPETIDVLCCVTPAGQVVYTTDDADARRVGRNWRAGLTVEQRAQHEAAHTMGGFVQIRMLREDYERIPATNESARLTAPSRED